MQEWTRAAHLVDPRLPVAPHQWSCHGNTRMSAECLSIFLPSSSWVPLHTSDLALQAMARNSFKVHTFTFQMVSQHLGRKEEGEEGREGRKKGSEGREGGRKGGRCWLHAHTSDTVYNTTYSLGKVGDGDSEWVFAVVLCQTHDGCEELMGTHCLCYKQYNASDHWLAVGQCSRLIKHHRLHLWK